MKRVIDHALAYLDGFDWSQDLSVHLSKGRIKKNWQNLNWPIKMGIKGGPKFNYKSAGVFGEQNQIINGPTYWFVTFPKKSNIKESL